MQATDSTNAKHEKIAKWSPCDKSAYSGDGAASSGIRAQAPPPPLARRDPAATGPADIAAALAPRRAWKKSVGMLMRIRASRLNCLRPCAKLLVAAPDAVVEVAPDAVLLAVAMLLRGTAMLARTPRAVEARGVTRLLMPARATISQCQPRHGSNHVLWRPVPGTAAAKCCNRHVVRYGFAYLSAAGGRCSVGR